MIVDTAVYVDGRRVAYETLEETFQSRREPNTFAAVAVHEPNQTELDAIAGELKLSKTLIENTIQRPRRATIQRHKDLQLIWLASVRYTKREEGARIGWIYVLLGEGLLVALSFGEGLQELKNVRQHVESEPERPWKSPRDVLREIVGEVFEGYDEAVANLDDDIAQAEGAVFDGKSSAARRIHALTRMVVELHQAIEPLAEALDSFLETADDETREALSQARHRIRRVTEKLDGFQDLLSSLLGLNLTMVGQKISAWGAILIVPTVIAGIFGMNAKHHLCGWIDCDYSLEVLVIFMGIVVGVLYLRFKRSGWL